MTGRQSITMLLSVAALAVPMESIAAPFVGTVAFSGSPGLDGGRCAPNPTRTVVPGAPNNATGTSSFGDFGLTLSECLGAAPPVPNLFTLDFADGTVFGTYTFAVTGMVVGGITFLDTYTIDGGTARFANAFGTFIGTGTTIFGAPPRITQALAGTLDVPEPTVALLFGMAAGGIVLRRRAQG